MNTWLEKQPDAVQFEKVPHTFLCEDTGEMYCDVCKQTARSFPNRSRRMDVYITQGNRFERFTEQHLHEVKL